MSGVSAIRGANVSPLVFDDPMMAAEAISIDAAREERNVARNERRTAQAERDSWIEQSIREERAAADYRLVSGVVSGAVKCTQAGLSIASTIVQRMANTPSAQATAERITDYLKHSSESLQAAGSVTTAVLDYIADGRRIHGKELEKAADRAREAADDARERAQSAGETASRLMSRMEDIARAYRQAEEQRIANIRG